ncbi:MAG: hypothetical protein MRK02_16195 [Candidatus Scalindua sp.]|nr:hypothetical protein [Candidatus Scalindua sp.]
MSCIQKPPARQDESVRRLDEHTGGDGPDCIIQAGDKEFRIVNDYDSSNLLTSSS